MPKIRNVVQRQLKDGTEVCLVVGLWNLESGLVGKRKL